MSRPLRQPREELRKAILEAATGILDRDGAEGLSARTLAREIGYTAASIYNVFESMSDILMEVNRDTLAEVAGLFQKLPEDADPAGKLRKLCQLYVSFMRANPARWNSLFGGLRQRDVFPEWYVGSITGLKGQLAALLIAHANGLQAAPADRLAENLFVSVHGAVSLEVGRRLDLLSVRSAEDVALAAVDDALTLARLHAG